MVWFLTLAEEVYFTIDCAECLTLDWVLRFLEAHDESAKTGVPVHFELDVSQIEEYLKIARR